MFQHGRIGTVWHMIRAGACAVALLATGTVSAQNDRINDEPTGWWYYYGASEAGIDAEMTQGRRPFNITPTGGNYDAVLVQNSGEYAATGMDVYWNTTVNAINTSLALSNNRIIDLEVVDPLTGTWSAVVVDNSGATAAPGWDWATGLTGTQLGTWQSGNGLRPIDVDQYSTLAGTRYSIVAVPNTGNNAQGWWWYFGVSAAQITSALTANGARLVDIDVVDNSPLTFNCIMVSQNNGLGVWHPGLSSSEVGDLINQTGGRLTCLQRYTDSIGATRFAVAIVDNSNAQTRRLRQYMDAELNSGIYGFRVQQVGGGVLASLNASFEFEPASMLKILHATYAMDQCAAGNDNLANNITIRDTCNNDECPDPAQPCNTGVEDLDVAIREMMEQSDNNRTMEIELRYGRTNLNNYAAALGLSGTHINHRLGCLCGQPFNTFTCVDACNLYELIADGSLFGQTWQDTLYELMSNGTGNTSSLAAIINTEAASTDLTASEIADFKSQVEWASKGGAYSCSGTYWRPEGGWVKLPFKSLLLGQYIVLPREYTTAAFVHGSSSSTESQIAYTMKFEMLREQIRQALESWDAACSTPVINNNPDAVTATEGDDVIFSIGLSVGSGSRTYQWQKQINNVYTDMSNVVGAVSGVTTNTLTLFNVNEADQARYRCVVSSICGTDTSASAALVVNPPPTGCDSIDFNGDGLFPDTQDIADFIAVFSGAPCPSGPGQCGDIDFNNDGLFPDTQDISTLISVFGGGPCI